MTSASGLPCGSRRVHAFPCHFLPANLGRGNVSHCFYMARPAGLEPATVRLEGVRRAKNLQCYQGDNVWCASTPPAFCHMLPSCSAHCSPRFTPPAPRLSRAVLEGKKE